MPVPFIIMFTKQYQRVVSQNVIIRFAVSPNIRRFGQVFVWRCAYFKRLTYFCSTFSGIFNEAHFNSILSMISVYQWNGVGKIQIINDLLFQIVIFQTKNNQLWFYFLFSASKPKTWFNQYVYRAAAKSSSEIWQHGEVIQDFCVHKRVSSMYGSFIVCHL